MGDCYPTNNIGFRILVRKIRKIVLQEIKSMFALKHYLTLVRFRVHYIEWL